MQIRAGVILLSLFFLLPSLASGQSTADSGRAKRLAELARAADQHEAAGREGDALAAHDAFFRALLEPEELDPVEVARAEAVLYRLRRLAQRTSYDASELLLGALAEVTTKRGRARSGAEYLESVRRRLHGHALAELGRGGEARMAMSELSYARAWWVVGPFDNARGTAWDDDTIAETAPDLTASYEGKERFVRWRLLPQTDYAGYVDLDSIMTPNDEAKAYALSFVHVPEATNAVVRVSSDEGCKVWVNGVKTVDRDVRRSARFDQDHAGTQLPAGWSRILVKVGEGEGEWKLALRLTDPEGAPISNLRWLAPGADVPAEVAEWNPEAEVADFEFSSGAVDVLRDLDAEGVAWASRDLGELLEAIHPHDRAQEPEREALQRAVERDPADIGAQFSLALSSQVFAERAADREENAYRQALEDLLAKHPDHVPALVALGDYYLDSLVVLEKARELYERADEASGGAYVPARLGLARVFSRRRWPGEAEARMTQLLEEHPKDPRVLASVSRMFTALGSDARAAEIRERMHPNGRQSESVAYALVSHYRTTGRDALALELLEERRALDPFEIDAWIESADIWWARDAGEEAEGLLHDLLAFAPENVDALMLRAQIHRAEGEEEAAVAALQTLLEVQPGNIAAQDYLDLLEPEEEEYEERFLESTDLVIEAAREREDSTDEGLVTVLQRQVMRVFPDGTSTTHVQLVRKITGKQGIQEVSRGLFLQGWGELDIKEARLIAADGSERECRHSGRRVIAPTPPPLGVGDIFDVRYRVQDTNPSTIFDGYFGAQLSFGGFERVQEMEYVIVSPREMPLYFSGEEGTPEPVQEFDEEEGVTITRFVARDLPRTEAEPLMPPAEELFPQVQVSSYETWEDFGKWWWGMIRKQHRLTDEMRTKMEELVAGLETPEEKVAAIYHFVTSEIRYVAWEFGVHGYKPYEAPTIFKRRFGDCKDKSILMNTMFEELGIEAYPVLIKLVQNFETRGEEDLRLPALTAFNHCISMVRLPSGDVFLDGTAKNYGFYKAPPVYDRGAHVLVVDPEQPELTRIPYFEPEDAATIQQLHVELAADGNMAFKHEMAIGSTGEEYWRSFLELEEMRVRQMSRHYAGRLPGSTIDEVVTTDLADLDAEVRVETTGRMPSFAQVVDDGLQLPIVPFRSEVKNVPLEQLGTLDRREHDMILGPPEMDELITRVALPAGMAPANVPEPIELSNDFFDFSLTVTVEDTDDGKELVVDRIFRKKTHRIPAERYGEARELLIAAANAEKRVLTLTRP